MHFSADEYQQRRINTCALMCDKGVDGLLIFRLESVYCLTGYDSALAFSNAC